LSHFTSAHPDRPAGRRATDPWRAARVAILSFIWPGLGHLALGRLRAAAILGAAGLVAALPLLWLLRNGVEHFLASVLLVPDGSRVLVVSAVASAAVRLFAIAHGVRAAGGIGPRRAPGQARSKAGTHRRATGILVAVLSLLVLLPHLAVAWVGLSFLDASSGIYVTEVQPPASPNPSGLLLGPGLPSDLGSLPTPYATPVPGGRINVLIIGADSGLGYDHSLTDTMILVSVDPATQKVAMISIPRDTSRFPLYNGGTYGGKLNSLANYAAANPRQFPDGGIGTLEREIGYMLGVPVHYYAFVNLAGFKSLIDAVGGVDIVNERAIQDAGYEFPDGVVGFNLSAGPHHLDGRLALAYVRSRYGPGDNDFTRARRQQQVLQALRVKMTDPAFLPRLPSLLKILASAIHTDFPAGGVPDMLTLARSMSDATVDHFVLGPPYATNPPNTSTYMLVQVPAKIRALSIKLFGADSAFAPPSPTSTGP
jgi:polyisoprenyl-teichoic acid--peptidoglycan teichoic acid transferase